MNEFENKLNRSHSESDLQNGFLCTSPSRNLLCSRNIYKSSPTIIRRTLHIEEIVFSADTMKPHNSRKNIFEKTDHNQTISFNDFRNQSARFSSSMLDQHSGIYSVNQYSDDVPMEIDTSMNYDERYPKIMGSGLGTPLKTEDIDISQDSKYKTLDNNLKQRLTQNKINSKVDFQNPPVSTIKCRNLADPQKLTHLRTVQEKKSNFKTILLLLTALVAVFFGYASEIFSKVSVNNDVQTQNIFFDLSNNVYEQPNVIDVVVRTLEQRENWPGKKKLLGFIGSQGVGKTYVTNIMKKHFAHNLAHEIYGPHLYYKTERDIIVDAIDDCCLNLIVIDDLSKKDDTELLAFIHSLPRDCFVLIISIFNIHYSTDDLEIVVNKDDIIEIRDSLDQSGLNHELVVFDDFTSEQIEGWVRKQLANQNVSSDVQESILRDVFDAHDVKHGLKGLHSKIILEIEKSKK